MLNILDKYGDLNEYLKVLKEAITVKINNVKKTTVKNKNKKTPPSEEC